MDYSPQSNQERMLTEQKENIWFLLTGKLVISSWAILITLAEVPVQLQF